MDIPNYTIFIRNSNFEIEGVIDHYSRLEFRIVYNDVGGWILDMANDGGQAVTTMKRLFRDQVGAYSGIIVTRNGKIVFSGVTRGFEQTGEYTGQEDQENITFFGMDDTGLIGMRVLMVPLIGSFPQQFIGPSNQNWDVWRYPDGHEKRTVSEVIYTMVADNISFTAPNSRNIPFLYIEKPGALGPESSVRGRYQNLLTKTQEISYYPGEPAYQNANPTYKGLQFRALQLEEPILVYSSGPDGVINTPVDPDNVLPYNTQIKKVQFTVRQPEDKSSTVVFSRGFKNLGSFRYKLQAPQTTYVVLGGQNNESTLINTSHTPNPITLSAENPRTRWLSHAASDSGVINLVTRYGLWESFLDRRDIQYGDDVYGQIEDPPESGMFVPITNPYPHLGPKYAPPTNPTEVSFNLAVDNYDAMIAEFTQAMQTELIEKRDLIEIEVDTINIYPTRCFEDYNIGDFVTVVIPDDAVEPIVERVREITVTLTKENGEVVKTTIGTETQPNGRDIFAKIINVNKKANFLEEIR